MDLYKTWNPYEYWLGGVPSHKHLVGITIHWCGFNGGNKKCLLNKSRHFQYLTILFGGERGIRTLDTL